MGSAGKAFLDGRGVRAIERGPAGAVHHQSPGGTTVRTEYRTRSRCAPNRRLITTIAMILAVPLAASARSEDYTSRGIKGSGADSRLDRSRCRVYDEGVNRLFWKVTRHVHHRTVASIVAGCS